MLVVFIDQDNTILICLLELGSQNSKFSCSSRKTERNRPKRPLRSQEQGVAVRADGVMDDVAKMRDVSTEKATSSAEMPTVRSARRPLSP
jgi:hypothetical protein